MATGDDVLAIIESAYAAALDERLWPLALARLAAAFGAVGATLEDFDKQPFGIRYFKIAGLPSQAETDYLSHYQFDNPRADYAFRNLSESILTDHALIDERGMERHPYYAKYLKSLDLRYFMSGQIANTDRHQAIVSIQRSHRQGHVQRDSVDRLARLLPHLRQAYDMARRLKRTQAAAHDLECVFDWLADGVALLARDGRVLYANHALLEITRRRDALSIAKSVLHFTSAETRGRFATTLAGVTALREGNPGDAAGGDFLIGRTGKDPPYIASVRPLARSGRDAGLGVAVAILFVHDPLANDDSAACLLRDVYSLTAAETDLADALRRGRTLNEYARERRLSLNTVYTHLRRIKEKTGTKRMATLIHRLNELSVPLRNERSRR